ncbi:MAG: peptidoglycan recognition family protein [Planctomycetota bacterium]
MGLTRRQAIMTSLGALALGGCSSTSRTSTDPRPIVDWRGYPARPSGSRVYTPVDTPTRQPINPTNQRALVAPASGVAAISRSSWTRTGPVRSKVNAMNGISKLTIHHDGMDPSYLTNKNAVAERIEQIRKYHVGENRWGDIGYHYIVDRSGRVWEGRPIQYQGAHVRNNNEHNIGILVLGNFDRQSPSRDQLKSLFTTTGALTKHHRIKTNLVRSHQEINKTACPGKNLQKQMNALRRHVG